MRGRRRPTRRALTVAGTVAYRSSTHTGYSGATSTSRTLTLPAGVVAGDILLAWFHIEVATAQTVTATGWTQIESPVASTGGPVNGVLLWKRAVASEATSHVFTYGTAGYSTGSMIAFSGAVSTGDPFGGSTGHGSVAQSTVTSINSVSYTATGTGLGVWLHNNYSDNQTVTQPSGYTKAYPTEADASITVATRADAAGSLTTGTGSATGGAVAGVTVALVILPGAAATAPATLTRLPMQPGAIYYGNLTGPTTTSYRQPGSLVITSRGNFGSADMIAAAAAGAHVLGYFDAIVWAVIGAGDVTGRLYNTSTYGPAVPEWPGPVSANGTGNLADFRPTSIMHQASSTNASWTKLEAVLESIVTENPHLAGFFADDLGSRSYFPNFVWSTFGTTNQQAYRDGAILVLQAFRRVCDRHGMFLMVNGTWGGGTLAAVGGGYPTLATHGCSLADGGVWEHHGAPDAYSDAMFSSTQWGSESALTGAGNAFHLSIGADAESPTAWTNSTYFAWFVQKSDYTVAPIAPWGSFHATGLPTGSNTTMSPPTGVSLLSNMSALSAWTTEDTPEQATITQLAGPGPGGDVILRNTLVDGQRATWDPVANERSDRAGPDIPNPSTRWMLWYMRVLQLPADIANGGFHILGPNEIHGFTLPQATVQPVIGNGWSGFVGRHVIDANAGSATHDWKDLAPCNLNEWHQWKMGVFYTQSASGWLEVWMDGVLLLREDGATTGEANNGYFKFGNYRSATYTGTTQYEISGCRVYG